jgi:hypothetical protein
MLISGALVLAMQIGPPVLAEEDSTAAATALEQFRTQVKESVRDAARLLDRFFADAEYETEQNTSSLRLRFDTDLEDREKLSFRFSPRLRLQLPGTERTVLFELQAESETVYEDNSFDRTGFFERDDDDGFELRLRYFTSKGETLIVPEVGLGFDDGSPQVFVGGRIRQFWDSNDDWTLLVSEQVRMNSDRGLESITRLQADILLGDDNLFRTHFNVNWREDEPGLSYGPGIGLFKPLDERSAIGFEWNALFETKPSHELEEIIGAIRYRQRVVTDWSIIEIAPRIMFAEQDNYSASYGILLRLDLEF